MGNKRSYGSHRGKGLPASRLLFVLHPEGERVSYRRTQTGVVTIVTTDRRGRTATLSTTPAATFDRLAAEIIREVITMAIRKRQQHDGGGPSGGGLEPCDLGSTLPCLVEFLTATVYEGGETRVPGSVTLFCGAEGGLKACLNDKDADETAFVSGHSLSGVLLEAETGLGDNRLDWRQNKRGKGRK